jgi:hypothetical protein
LQRQRRTIEEILERHGEKLLARPDVTSVGVQLKLSGGETAQPPRYAIRICVAHKYAARDCRRRGTLLPKRFHNVPTDVIEARFDYCLNASLESRAYHPRPGGGCAIAREDCLDQWGTLGLVVNVGSRRMYLTNKHVVGPRGSIVVQPPLPVRPLSQHQWQIGTVLRAGADDNRLVDCALVEPHTEQGQRLPGPALLAAPQDVLHRTLVEGLLDERDLGRTRVVAWGAVSGPRFARVGVVRQTQAAVKFPDGTRLVRQIQVESLDDQPIVAPGDSGAVLLKWTGSQETERIELVGLVVGQYEEAGGRGRLKHGLVANHIGNVRRSLRFAKLG